MRQLTALLVAGWLAFCTTAYADRASDEARRHYETGTRHYSLGEFAAAVDEYRAAYALKSDAAFLYNIAQAYRLLGDRKQALFFYRSYLLNRPDADNRGEVEERIRRLEQEAAHQPPAVPAPSVPAALPTTTAAGSPSNELTASAPASTGQPPLYKRWWLWTAVGGVAAVGLGVGLGVGLSSASAPSTHFGSHDVF